MAKSLSQDMARFLEAISRAEEAGITYLRDALKENA